MKNTYLAIIVLSLLFTSVSAQLAPPLASKKTASGISISSKGNKPFSIEVKGKEIKQLESREDGFLYSVDGKMLNITITKASVVLGKEKISGEENLLKAHQKWELNFQSSFLFQKPLTIAEEETVFVDLGKTAKQHTLFWYFNTPETSTKSGENRRALQTTTIGDVFLALGSPLNKEDSLADRRQFFNEILSSLKLLTISKPKRRGSR
jgi:hypothetical protein